MENTVPNDNLKIIIPMAGFGTRLRPHTWSKPKPLVSAAGRAVLSHVLETFATAPDFENVELVFIIGYLGDQVRDFMQENYPEIKAHYVVQEEMLGQSHAVAFAREFMHGPTLLAFVDTLVETDLSFLADEDAEAVIWVKRVEDPRRFGVVEVGEGDRVTGLIEKPDSMENDLAIVGLYYFKRGQDLMATIDKQIAEDRQTKGEYFLADAMDMMLKDGLHMRPERVDIWLDAGLPETVLETNHYLLDNGRDNTAEIQAKDGVTITDPVFVDPSAEISNSNIGPHVSIGANCKIENSTLSDAVLEAGAEVSGSQLTHSILGERATIENVKGSVNIGDDSSLKGEPA